MSTTEHTLKTLARYWEAIEDGRKTFEVRRNDRAFQTGDVLVLEKMDNEGRYYEPTTPGGFIESGYCVLGLGEPLPSPPREDGK